MLLDTLDTFGPTHNVDVLGDIACRAAAGEFLRDFHGRPHPAVYAGAMNIRTLAVALPLVFGLAGAAASQPIELTVDAAQSTITVNIELVTPVGTRSSEDDSPITGTATVELDDAGMPASITLIDYVFAAQNDLTFAFNYGVLGSVNGVGSGLGLRQPAGSPSTSGAVDGAGAFGLIGVPNESLGTIDASGSGVIGATIGSVSIDLATLGASNVDASGTIAIAGDQVTATIVVPINTSNELQPGVTANITGTASVVATGVIASACPADTNGDGMLSPADFNGWIIAFNTQSPACDQNGDGACTPADFNGWILNFNAGC